MKPRVYIETSVISYLASRSSALIHLLVRQQRTREFWDALEAQRIEGFVSDLVVTESSRGDQHAAARRLAFIEGLPQFVAGEQSQNLARDLIVCGAVPSSEPEDALHIALATVAKVDYIASWNFAHLVGPQAKRRLSDHIRALGHDAPLLATPDEILEEINAKRT